MSAAEIRPLGRFNVRIVPDPEPLYSGLRHDFSRERHDYERGTILELYDAAYRHTPAGQFISAYHAETIAAMTPGAGLSLQGDVPAWTMSEDETASLIEIARRV